VNKLTKLQNETDDVEYRERLYKYITKVRKANLLSKKIITQG
jgi:hypothetical protein